ncbi:hypothetical protein [Rhodovulum sp. PH10]|uniref:hypothetical protein n=1 Tax=Rhodovulum sp. PH10 TaxID=1187851 RepID=UPI0012F89DFF|nr:hypothetical protein [Rhodovulum sp. PH10]
MRRSPRAMLLDPERHRRNATSFFDQARTTGSAREQEHFARMARTSELLAKNADWVRSLDVFLADLRAK